MNIAILTNEYPPNIYGGAGVHVDYLTRELAKLDDGGHLIQVLCFGDQDARRGNLTVQGVHPRFSFEVQDPRHGKVLGTLLSDLAMAGLVEKADIAHGHTWYSHFAGCLLKQLAGAKLVLTTHSLEPHRPWKVEQLGTGYYASRWIEQTAYQNADGVIAVSESMKQDVHDLYGVPFERIRVIPNGIDLDEYQAVSRPDVLEKYGIDPDRPFLLFVGRITRQKGIIHLVNAIPYLDPKLQIVLCAGAPDTPEIAAEMTEAVERARTARGNAGKVFWIDQMLPDDEKIAMYSHAAVFVCPSVYEPFGIINLEAMACETPVVASKVGGIPEIVVPEETGLLVPLDAVGETNFEPKDPDRFSRDLAAAVNRLVSSPHLLTEMGRKSRERVEQYYSWTRIAERTLAFYDSLLKLKR